MTFSKEFFSIVQVKLPPIRISSSKFSSPLVFQIAPALWSGAMTQTDTAEERLTQFGVNGVRRANQKMGDDPQEPRARGYHWPFQTEAASLSFMTRRACSFMQIQLTPSLQNCSRTVEWCDDADRFLRGAFDVTRRQWRQKGESKNGRRFTRTTR